MISILLQSLGSLVIYLNGKTLCYLIMSEEDSSSRKRRILRFIRDLDLRYIRGSIDRRTYQTLKSKYQEMLTSLPQTLKISQEVKQIEETKESLPELESDINQNSYF